MTATSRFRSAGRLAARSRRPAGLALRPLGAPAQPAAARADGRVVAIGDVHGSDDGFLADAARGGPRRRGRPLVRRHDDAGADRRLTDRGEGVRSVPSTW